MRVDTESRVYEDDDDDDDNVWALKSDSAQ